jgi:MraZ protein
MAMTDYFQRKLDDKRRLTIPAEVRTEFASGVVVTRGFGRYLHLYSKDVWYQTVEPALRGDILDEQMGDKNAKLRMGKIEADLDLKQGRFTLDNSLVDYAGISKEIVAVRAGQYWRIVASELADI